MSRLRLFLQTAAAVASVGSAAQASIITTATQTLNFGPQRTEFGGLTQALNYFDSNLGTLQSITMNSSFGFTSNITVSNSAATSSTGTATAEGALILSAQNGGVNSVVQGLLNTAVDPLAFGGYSSITMDITGTRRSYNLAPNTSVVLASNAATHALGQITDTTIGDLLAFEVAGGGSTNLIANTFTQTNLANNGGNTTTSEATTAQATFSIFYTYDNSTATPPPPPPPPPSNVPEPASLALLGFGVLGAGLLRRNSR